MRAPWHEIRIDWPTDSIWGWVHDDARNISVAWQVRRNATIKDMETYMKRAEDELNKKAKQIDKEKQEAFFKLHAEEFSGGLSVEDETAGAVSEEE